MTSFTSDVNLGLKPITSVLDPMNLANELQDILSAFRIVQLELTDAKRRIALLEAYNIAHP